MVVSCHGHRGQCKTWTLDSGLDRGLDSGLDFGLDIGLNRAIVTPYTADVGVAYCITPYTTKKSRSHVDFCDGHRVTGSLAARSRGHWQFLDGHR